MATPLPRVPDAIFWIYRAYRWAQQPRTTDLAVQIETLIGNEALERARTLDDERVQLDWDPPESVKNYLNRHNVPEYRRGLIYCLGKAALAFNHCGQLNTAVWIRQVTVHLIGQDDWPGFTLALDDL